MTPMTEMPHKYVPPPLELVKSRIEEILPPDAREEIDSGDVLVVDVREPDRFESGHLEGAVNVSSGESARGAHDSDYVEALGEAGGDAGKRLILYCGEGNRSARTADALRNEHGFENVASIVGGVKLWNDLGYPVEGEIVVGADDAELGEGMEGDTT
jgi:sulfur-carrier protein adenylyltransferase/sulfurtransferase